MPTRTRSLPPPSCRDGTAATEFIIVLPLMMLVGIASLDLGRAVQHYSVMSNAAGAGAQYAATNRFFEPYTRPAWEAKVRSAVQEELASLGVPVSDFDIRIATTTTPVANSASRPPLPQITVSIDFDYPTMLRWPGLPSPIPLHCKSAIRQYR